MLFSRFEACYGPLSHTAPLLCRPTAPLLAPFAAAEGAHRGYRSPWGRSSDVDAFLDTVGARLWGGRERRY